MPGCFSVKWKIYGAKRVPGGLKEVRTGCAGKHPLQGKPRNFKPILKRMA
jgi:hypothetical protein